MGVSGETVWSHVSCGGVVFRSLIRPSGEPWGRVVIEVGGVR